MTVYIDNNMENYSNIKCNKGFQTKYVYIDNNPIHVDEYIQNKKNYIGKPLLCRNGHELYLAHGEKNKPHFRHKNPNDMEGKPMSEWHSEWQSNFPITEYPLSKLNETQYKNRFLDVYIKEHDIVLEFQHSKPKDPYEFEKRKHDYDLHNMKSIWVIDGKYIKIARLEHSNRCFLDFLSNHEINWKYRYFICYDIIFIDINGWIYKISPKYVKNDMIDIENPIEKSLFIQYLQTNDPYLYTYETPTQCNLYIEQRGAGNGKTFGLIQRLQSEEFEHYRLFIITSKQHSAKHVIFNEFKNQIKNGDLPDILLDGEPVEENKKYKISYINKKTGNKCQIIIGTIDSFMYALGNKHNNSIDNISIFLN